MKENGALWKWILLLLAVALAICAAFYFDQPVRSWVTEHPNRAAKEFMRLVGRIGDWPAHVLAGLIVVAVAKLRGSERWVRIGLTMLLACALAGLVARAMKITSARPRPSARHELRVHRHRTFARFTSRNNSFPSGHTAATTGFFGVLLFARRRLGLVLLPIPLLIAGSRIYVAAHFLSDVVCGAVLGLFCAWILWRLQERFFGSAASA